MKREIIVTGDGSKTIHIPEWDEQYHSKHGAIQEARHVFLKTGLQHYVSIYPTKTQLSILEIGFGTGLNALLSYFEGKELGVTIEYEGVEAYPVSTDEAIAVDYASQLQDDTAASVYNAMHEATWEQAAHISNTFSLKKREQTFETISDSNTVNLIFYDAFGPRVQPELWTSTMFTIMYNALKSGGVLTTYCAQGAARRAMQQVGFEVERLPGPPGKREMLRATKH